jgi:CheY-like chemotaxis protein
LHRFSVKWMVEASYLCSKIYMTMRKLCSQAHLDGMKILVVDDDAATREMMQAVLALMGAEVMQASSGEEALACWQAWRPSAILSDIAMPKMNGYEFLRALRALEPKRGLGRTPAIAVSGYSAEEGKAMARDAGFDRYMTKPADPIVLAAMIGDLCDDRRLAQTANRH